MPKKICINVLAVPMEAGGGDELKSAHALVLILPLSWTRAPQFDRYL